MLELSDDDGDGAKVALSQSQASEPLLSQVSRLSSCNAESVHSLESLAVVVASPVPLSPEVLSNHASAGGADNCQCDGDADADSLGGEISSISDGGLEPGPHEPTEKGGSPAGLKAQGQCSSDASIGGAGGVVNPG